MSTVPVPAPAMPAGLDAATCAARRGSSPAVLPGGRPSTPTRLWATMSDDISPPLAPPVRYMSAGASIGTIVRRLGGCSIAVHHWLMPRYESPTIPTSPVDHG